MLAKLGGQGLVLFILLGRFLRLRVFGKEGLNHLPHRCRDRFYEFQFLVWQNTHLAFIFKFFLAIVFTCSFSS